jgi:ABC-type dipeptide/oligopeptide/nickel transport system ATPase component
MNDGKKVEEGKVEEIFKSPKQEYTKKLLEAIPNRQVSLRRRRR